MSFVIISIEILDKLSNCSPHDIRVSVQLMLKVKQITILNRAKIGLKLSKNYPTHSLRKRTFSKKLSRDILLLLLSDILEFYNKFTFIMCSSDS